MLLFILIALVAIQLSLTIRYRSAQDMTEQEILQKLDTLQTAVDNTQQKVAQLLATIQNGSERSFAAISTKLESIISDLQSTSFEVPVDPPADGEEEEQG